MDVLDHNKALIMRYWHSWQIPDWKEMRSCLANEINFGGYEMSSDDFIGMCQQGSPWEDVKLLSSLFTVEGGALLYEGYDTGHQKVVRVGEFIQVRGELIVSSIGSFGSGTPTQ